MAVTDIQATVLRITGVTPTANSVEDAQMFVASKIPKDLLKWAITETVAASHGGNNSNQQITLPVKTDSLVYVRRDQFEASPVDSSMRGFIGNSNSLHLATDTFPKYYIADGNRVIVKPDPDNTYTAHAQYVDYSKIDDDSDLRNVVVFHSAAQEFEKLASSKVTDWSDLSVPAVPSLTSVTFSSIDSDVDASAPVFITASVSAGSIYTGSAPTYLSPVKQSQVAFADYWTLTDFGDADPGSLSISSNPPVSPPLPNISSPGVASQDIADITGNVPTYIAPVMSVPDFNDANTWINTEEDPEMVAARIQTINAQISEYAAKIQDSLNSFNEENAKYQANVQAQITKVQIDSQEKQKEGDLTFQASVQDYSQELSLFGAKVQEYQAEVGKEVQEYTANMSRYQLELNTVYTAWAKTESDNISLYQSDIQNELNSFNEKSTAFQAQVQESMQEIQVANQVNIAKAQSDLQLSISNEDRSQQRQLQNALQDMQAVVSDNESKMTKFQGELAKYQAETGEKAQKITSATQNAAYYSNESKKYYEWAVAEVNMYIQNNSKMINKTMAAQAAQQRR